MKTELSIEFLGFHLLPFVFALYIWGLSVWNEGRIELMAVVLGRMRVPERRKKGPVNFPVNYQKGLWV